MEIMRKLIKLFLHVNRICSLVLLTIQVLDWYNPYMDFMGHTTWVLYTLCVSTLLQGILAVFRPAKRTPVKAVKKRGNNEGQGATA